jgi:hypothetical protein
MPTRHLKHHNPTINKLSYPPKLDVVAVVSNSRRYESRYHLFKNFMAEMEANPDVRLTVVEMAFRHRPHYIVDDDNERHIKLRNHHELWVKECMINVGISRLPDDWQYVAWIDGDISFVNKDWATETIEALQHYQVVQPWTTAMDLGPEGNAFQTHKSFGACYLDHETNVFPQYPYGYGKPFPHPGYAWAARREAIERMGNYMSQGLLNTAILGAGDHHMAWALIGNGAKTVPKGVHPNYLKAVVDWEKRAQALKRNIGALPGSILHHWHGKKKDRKYTSRWKILEEFQFDPEMDVLMDWQGLWQLEVIDERQRLLRDAVREYMASRNEDSIDED